MAIVKKKADPEKDDIFGYTSPRKRRRRKGKRRGSRTPLVTAKETRTRNTSTADTLKTAVCSYFLKGGYSCFQELGVTSWGTLRADVICVNLRRRIVICEVKSGPRDYRTDKKWREYAKYCNRLYIVMCDRTYEKLKDELKVDLKGTGAGVMVLNPTTGYLDIVVPCKKRELDDEVSMNLITRMAWRGGISKRTNRRTRQYLRTQEDEAQEAEQKEESGRRGRKRRPA